MRNRLVLLAAAAAFSVWLAYRALVLSTTGQRLDQFAMVESMQAAPTSADHLRDLMQAVSVPSIAVAVGVLAAIAVKRSRPDLLGLDSVNSFPSGHVTVVSSLAAGALLVMPRRAQPTVAVLGVVATAVTAVATVALGWHRPSDVIGAVGVVTAWAAIAGAWATGRSSSPSTPSTPSMPTTPSESRPSSRRVVVQSNA